MRKIKIAEPLYYLKRTFGIFSDFTEVGDVTVKTSINRRIAGPQSTRFYSFEMDSDSDSSSRSLDEEYYTTPEEDINDYDQKFEAPEVNNGGDTKSNIKLPIIDASNGTQTSNVEITTAPTPNLQNKSEAIKAMEIPPSDDNKDKPPTPRKDEVEFIVKNLDTGTVFSSKDIDKFIPKTSADPISHNILRRSFKDFNDNGNSTSSPIVSPRKEKRGSKVVAKIWKMTKKKSKEKEKEVKVVAPPKEIKKKLFAQVFLQQMNEHKGAVWDMKFNYDGLYLASGGEDKLLRVWKVIETDVLTNGFFQTEVLAFEGHSDQILAIAWSNSRSNLILSASVDKTVRLWNLRSKDAVAVFDHTDHVSAVEMHPKDEDRFISGSLDGTIRIWSIRDKQILTTFSLESGFLTRLAFTLDGNSVLAGTHEGECTVFDASRGGLNLDAQFSVRGSNKKTGKKISGIQMHPNGKQALITTNDSRLRLYDLKEYFLVATYKGLKNKNFQINATFSDKGMYIISGSEDHQVYMWETTDPKKKDKSNPKIGSYDFFKAHGNVVTCALFAPFTRRKTKLQEGQIIVTCDSSGEIKVFENKDIAKPV